MYRADLKKWNVISYIYIEWVSCGILSEKVFILYSRTHEKLSVWRFFFRYEKINLYPEDNHIGIRYL